MNNIIADRNDYFRKNLSQGTLVLTQGIRSNTPEELKQIITKVRNFDTFDENNDLTMSTILEPLIIRAGGFSGRLITTTKSFCIFRRMYQIQE